MNKPRSSHIETQAVHSGRTPDPTTGAVMPPIHLSTTFVRNEDGPYTDDFVYSRSDNPNRRTLEGALVALEEGAAAAAFASGMAAASAILQTLEAGQHVILPDDAYFLVNRLVEELLSRRSATFTIVDMTDLDAVAAAVRPETALIWTETPSNPQLKITDLAAVAQIAHDAHARCVCDNTWPTPLGQRPLSHGVDLVLHSTTKYLGGHSDILGGAVIARTDDDFFELIRTIQHLGGGVPSPFDCWLLLRSIRTLPYRMRGHFANAQVVAEFLAQHPLITHVHYPGLAAHPGHEIAQRQMDAFGGMLSIQVAGGEAAARRVANRVRLFTQATSLGGVESLIEHRYAIEGPDSLTPPALLRLSIGLEHPDDLIADLDQALAGEN
jgi:cystathionine gamma-synthase